MKFFLFSPRFTFFHPGDVSGPDPKKSGGEEKEKKPQPQKFTMSDNVRKLNPAKEILDAFGVAASRLKNKDSDGPPVIMSFAANKVGVSVVVHDEIDGMCKTFVEKE
jgi:hypothetical protein